MSKIPKIIHFFWDKSPLSYLQYLTVVSFHQFNPDWKIMVHETNKAYGRITWNTPENRLKHSGRDYYSKLRELDYVEFNDVDFEAMGFSEDLPDVYKSDYIRWHLLATIGGVWSDMDILYIKPLSELNIPDDKETVICYGPEKHIIGFLMSKPNNEFFNKVLFHVRDNFDPSDYQSIGSKLLNRYHDEAIHRSDVHNLSVDAFYAYNHHLINKIFNDTDLSLITNETIGIHWYNGSAISKMFTNIFDEDTTSLNNIITLLIKEHLV
jgi:hypothetical protein